MLEKQNHIFVNLQIYTKNQLKARGGRRSLRELLGFVWEFIKEWNGMIIKGMEWNGIEWNGFSREMNGMEWNGM